MGKFRYCVLYTRADMQHKVKEIIENNLPEDRGQVIVPMMEYYSRREKRLTTMSIFPGYVFLYTDMDVSEVHDFMLSNKGKLSSYVNEVTLKTMKLAGISARKAGEDDGAFALSDLTGPEEEFLELLRQGNGLLDMSYGYQLNGRYYVMEGPLKAYEDRIVSVDKHNRKAFLEFEVKGKKARAGFECKPRSHWFPEESGGVTELADGTEVDLEELSRSLMTLK